MLKVENLVAGYGKVQVLHGLTLSVEKGKLVTLIGSNGAGKTTTLRALSGMIRPESGTIMLAGKPIAGLPSHAITRRGLAHSPEGRRVFATLSVADNLVMGAFPRLTGSRPRGDVAADLERMYALFPRLAERRVQLAGTLSGGEQQMLAMARALMLNPDVLLLDEPSMGLAPRLVADVFATIARLKEAAITMLLVEQFAAGGVGCGGLWLCDGERAALGAGAGGGVEDGSGGSGGVSGCGALMQGAANGLLLLDAALFFMAAYRLGWAVNADAGLMPPNLGAMVPGLKRMYRLSMGLAFCSCLMIAGHLVAQSWPDAWLWTRGAIAAAAVLAGIAAWFSVVAHRHVR